MKRRTALTVLAALGGLGLVASLAFTAATRTFVTLFEFDIPAVAFWVTGVIAFGMRPAHPTAQRLLFAGSLLTLGLGLTVAVDAAGAAARETAPVWLLNSAASLAADVALAAWFTLFATFPSGRFPNRWIRYSAVAAYLLAALTAVAGSLVRRPGVTLAPGLTVVSPIPSWLAVVASHFPVTVANLFWLLPAAVILMIARAVSARGEERIQLTWPLLTMALLSVVILISPLETPLNDIPSPYSDLVFGLLISSVPASLLVGMLHHRLLDLDLVLRRSLTFGLLWLAIAVAYAGLAALAGVLVGERLSTGAAVAVTIVAAMLFQPARERLEQWADHVIFGDRERGYRLIRQLGSVLGGSLGGDEVAPQIASTVQEGLAASWARTAVCGPEGVRFAGAAGISIDGTADAELVVPLVHGEELVGFLECGPRRTRGYTARDGETLQTLGRQAAVALVNSRLAADLAASRARLVHAEAQERRRIERDIHDGVQQHLVALMVRLSLARTQLKSSPDRAAATLDEMQGDFRSAVAELRDLANGIHPAVLADRGLVAALEARAALIPVAVEIKCPAELAVRRFPADAETAAYFACVEAIGNALKHACASSITITVAAADRCLSLLVEDDGRGFDPAGVVPHGLRGMRDRLEGAAGHLEIRSRPGLGTTVALSLPIPEPVGV